MADAVVVVRRRLPIARNLGLAVRQSDDDRVADGWSAEANQAIELAEDLDLVRRIMALEEHPRKHRLREALATSTSDETVGFEEGVKRGQCVHVTIIHNLPRLYITPGGSSSAA